MHGFRLKISIFLITCVTTVKAHSSWRQQRIHGRQRIHALQFVLLTTNTLMYTPLDKTTLLCLSICILVAVVFNELNMTSHESVHTR